MRLLLLHILIGLFIPFSGMTQNVKWEQTTVNFGTVRDWNSPAATFTFKNSGKEKLMLLPQRHKRDVLVRYPNRSIRPGETGTITIQYYTGETGLFSRTVEVYTNASNKPVKLTVKGNIKSIYADALTQCPSFQTTTSNKSEEPNAIQVVDRRTDRPITGAQVEIYDRGIRKAVNGTNLDGVAVNWVETGKYIAVAYKEGYEKAEQDVSFSKRNRSSVIYLDRKSREPDEPIVALEHESIETTELQEEEVDLGISLNDQIEQQDDVKGSETVEEFDLGISTNNQWEEPQAVVEAEPETEENLEETMDLGISLNEQIEEEPVRSEPVEEKTDPSTSLSTSLGINTNEAIAEEGPAKPVEPSVEDLVEEALAQAEITDDVVQEPVVVGEVEPEFSSEKFKPNNVLLLIDVSGSMKDDDKMGKLKKSVRRMIMMLREVDVLTMIAYNSSSWQVLAPTPVTDNEAIVALVDSLKPSGYTNGVKGMESAYESLFEQLIPDGNNQLIIATDGKFNSSKFSEKDAVKLVKSNSDKGIVLSIIGFGEDREATRLMRKLAKEGNGSFMQISKGENPTELLAEEIKNRSRID